MAPNTEKMMAALEVVELIHDDISPTSSMVMPDDTRELLSKLGKVPAPVTSENKLRPLHCVAQQYGWGRVGSSSTVARMKAAQDPDFVIDESLPYAELWLGTHPNGMSTVSVDDSGAIKPTLLSDHVASNPRLHCGTDGSSDLSFLFKVLSINKVLSIQAHPDKKLAERLHATLPHIYRDPNHKPEMAIALSDQVKAMCGFHSIEEIQHHVKNYPEFGLILGEEVTNQVRSVNGGDCRVALQNMFKSYLECAEDLVQIQLTNLLERLKANTTRDELQELILQLAEQFPGDAGIFAPLMFNIVTCKRGEAIFIGANEPHAYISGELIECMACSDNVVRAGLTPKLKDVDTLVKMLTYKSGSPDIHHGDVIDECTTRYEPPVADFCVEVIKVPAGGTYKLIDMDSPSIILTLSGSGTLVQQGLSVMDVSFGSSAFCSANTSTIVLAGPNGVTLTRAFKNVFHAEAGFI